MCVGAGSASGRGKGRRGIHTLLKGREQDTYDRQGASSARRADRVGRQRELRTELISEGTKETRPGLPDVSRSRGQHCHSTGERAVSAPESDGVRCAPGVYTVEWCDARLPECPTPDGGASQSALGAPSGETDPRRCSSAPATCARQRSRHDGGGKKGDATDWSDCAKTEGGRPRTRAVPLQRGFGQEGRTTCGHGKLRTVDGARGSPPATARLPRRTPRRRVERRWLWRWGQVSMARARDTSGMGRPDRRPRRAQLGG